MEGYKLSHTAAEIDDKLNKIEDGGTGYTEGETIHHIDQKYLPGVCLPVVELSTVIAASNEPTTMNEADSAALSEAHKRGMPVILKYDYGGQSYLCSVSDWATVGFVSTLVMFMADDTVWVAITD